MLEIVIINYNTGELTCRCIQSVFDTIGSARILVVDNASTDNSIEEIRGKYPEIKIIHNSENLGYAKAVNIGVRNTDSEFVIVSNSDVEFLRSSINEALDVIQSDESIAVTGFHQLYPGMKYQRSYGRFPGYISGIFDMFFITSFLKVLNKYLLNTNRIIYPEYADGAVLLFRRSVFDRLLGFDEDYFFYTEEADFCKRVWNSGYKVSIANKARVIHIRGAGREKSDFNEKAEKLLISTKLLFLKKHGTKSEAKLFKFTQKTYFFNLFVIELILSKFSTSKKYFSKSQEHLRISKLWKKAEIE
ncbi:MAG: glycosyltransferase family 2 protein [Candidatus Kapabacteria bacterium]|nr:glycosyltransferase family 2 protein [Ignavibacteriota bacterium]MCW5885822.1 glycosyltransferase family 2 protein [Candidatus Kapabacteria bacterium]